MPRRAREKVHTDDYRRQVIGAPANEDEKLEFTAAAERAGYRHPGTCAREVLLAWARGELARVKPAGAGAGAPIALEDVTATLKRQGKV